MSIRQHELGEDWQCALEQEGLRHLDSVILLILRLDIFVHFFLVLIKTQVHFYRQLRFESLVLEYGCGWLLCNFDSHQVVFK